jgi:hypothetical protein
MRRQDKNDLAAGVALLVGLILLIGGGVWLRSSVPCSFWSWAPAKEVPARCFMEGK